MSAQIFSAIGLVCVIEGLTYALVPQHIKKMMVGMLHMSDDQLRVMGTVVLALGVGLVALTRIF